MKTTIAVLVLLVVTVGTVYTQSPPALPNDLPKLPNDFPTVQTTPNQNLATGPTIEQLLDRIEKIRAQKAELEKQEQAAVAEVRKKMVTQTERLNKLGLGAPAAPPVASTTGGTDLAPTIRPGALSIPSPPLPQPNRR
jgi:hypothetical protein